MLLHTLELLGLMALGAIGFRIRGGWLEGARYQPGNQVSRLTWAVACALATWHVGLWALALVPIVWAVSTLGLWDTIDQGRRQVVVTPGEAPRSVINWPDFWLDVLFGSLHGLTLGAGVAALLWWLGLPLWWLALVGGAAWEAAYALAYVAPLPTHKLGLGHGAQQPESGEIYFGLEFAAALYFASGGVI